VKYILIAILCIGLHSTNPSKTDFIEFASIQIKKKYPELDFKPESNATSLEKLISGFGNTMVSNFLTESTTQKDYWIFSIFEVDMKLARDFGVKEKNIKVIGILNKFIPMPDLKSDEWQIIFK
jgi:hypothetical protein